eukprot:1145823-Pelagomonas_calceolata.AAC.4
MEAVTPKMCCNENLLQAKALKSLEEAAAAAAASQVEYSAHKPKWHGQSLAKSHADSSRKSRLVHQSCYLPTALPSEHATRRSIASQITSLNTKCMQSLNAVAWPTKTLFWPRQFLSLTRGLTALRSHCLLFLN